MRAAPLLLLLACLAVPTSCASTGPSGLPLISIKIGDSKVQAEVAQSPDQTARGLMYRRELGRNAGMLFVYEDKQALSFWMKNTFVPLTIAFIADDGTVIHLEDMQPQTLVSHRSPEPVRYALEVNQGWFKERGLAVGVRAEFELPEP